MRGICVKPIKFRKGTKRIGGCGGIWVGGLFIDEGIWSEGGGGAGPRNCGGVNGETGMDEGSRDAVGIGSPSTSEPSALGSGSGSSNLPSFSSSLESCSSLSTTLTSIVSLKSRAEDFSTSKIVE